MKTSDSGDIIMSLEDFNSEEEKAKQQEDTNPMNPINPTNLFSKSPLFRDEIFPDLPKILQECCKYFSGRDRDIMLIGSLTVLSACMPNVYGSYDNSLTYPNLYLFVSGPASGGKGVLKHCAQIAVPIHDLIFSQNKVLQETYLREYSEFKKLSVKNPSLPAPQKPVTKLLFIPANNSASGVFQLLNGNDGKGLIFETEGDTLSNTFKKDYGDFSDNFRKAFHHEPITLYRKTNMEYGEVKEPKLSAVLSGTPRQILSLIPNSEDGLLSRFIFYIFDMTPQWKNVFNGRLPDNIADFYWHIGKDYLNLYNNLSMSTNKVFSLTESQISKHTMFFSENQKKYYNLFGSEATASINRLGIITFRLAMILTVLRQGFQDKYICENLDFDIAMHISQALLEHAIIVYKYVNSGNLKGNSLKDRFFNLLPDDFDREIYLKAAQELTIADSTAQKYINDFLKDRQIVRTFKNRYQKV